MSDWIGVGLQNQSKQFDSVINLKLVFSIGMQKTCFELNLKYGLAFFRKFFVKPLKVEVISPYFVKHWAVNNCPF